MDANDTKLLNDMCERIYKKGFEEGCRAITYLDVLAMLKAACPDEVQAIAEHEKIRQYYTNPKKKST